MFDVTNSKHLMKAYAPATLDEIAEVETALSLVIPEVYKDFLLATDGAECNLASLYGAASLIEMNRAYEVQQYAPGYLSIGNDGGGYHLLMQANASAKAFRLVSDGVGVPADNNCKDIFDEWLVSDEGNPWRNEKS